MGKALTLALPPEAGAATDPMPSIRGNVIAGTAAIVIGLGGFLLWGYTVHLDSAAVAAGSVIVNTKAKTVTHLEGGILGEMFVKEGDLVVAGQPLLRLADTRAASDLKQYQARRIGFVAKLARLRAEQAGADHVDFPPELTGSTNLYVSQILTNEQLLFRRRRETLQRTIGVQRSQIDGFVGDVTAAKAQLDANANQQRLTQDQIVAIGSLVGKGFATQAQLSGLQSQLSQLISEAGAMTGARTRAEGGISQAELEISKSETAWQSDVADALQTTQIELSAINDSIAAAADVLKRVVVTSPEDGVVNNIQVRTPGGVIGPGQAILDIVPANGAKIIEARLDPRDIDSVKPGAKVQIRLTAYGSKLTPLDGVLNYVAADQSVDEHSGVAYYVVRAAISEAALAHVPNVVLYAGEPADLLIVNRPRMAIDYILSPFTDSLGRAAHEE